jgi:hypothetical protein
MVASLGDGKALGGRDTSVGQNDLLLFDPFLSANAHEERPRELIFWLSRRKSSHQQPSQAASGSGFDPVKKFHRTLLKRFRRRLA